MAIRVNKMSLLVLGMAMLAAPAQAVTVKNFSTDKLIEGAKQCTRHMPRLERQYGIPLHLLSAISSTETGRWHKVLKIALPWPWTINAEGKGYYYDSKAEAIAAARKLQAQGIKSMDVGCMQVNLRHHPDAFANLDQAFEPETNIAYAASFLRNLYQEERNWQKAAAGYHSKTPVRGAEYMSKVYNSWQNIIQKVRGAQVGTAQTASRTNASTPVVLKPSLNKEGKIKPSVKPSVALGEQTGKKLAAQKPVHMNSIKVSKAGKRENGVIVVRPDVPRDVAAAMPNVTVTQQRTKPAPEVQLADMKPAAGPVASKVVPVGNAAPRQSGPRFIFDN